MSNLPQIFRRSYTSDLKKPEKQGGVFSVRLNTNLKEDQYWARRTSTALTKQSLPRTACRTGASSGRKNYLSARSSLVFYGNEIHNTQQENLKLGACDMTQFCSELKSHAIQLSKEISQLQSNTRTLKQSLSDMRTIYQQSIVEIEQKCRGYFLDIRELLSRSRRQTWKETKTNKMQVELLEGEIEQSKQILEQFQGHLNRMQNQILGQADLDLET